jgi:hypothetical protein
MLFCAVSLKPGSPAAFAAGVEENGTMHIAGFTHAFLIRSQ